MANPFQDFIQLELPKRPFLETDAAQETIFIRRGVAPREMAGLVIANGQVLGKVGGVLQGVVPTTAEGVEHIQESPAVTWTITHNKNNKKCIVQIVDANDDLVFADNVKIELNAITLTFTNSQGGRANIMFY